MSKRPLRSLLFAPGNQPRKVERVATFGADAVILDLEDAVPIAEKAATRPVVRAALGQLAAGPSRYVRVNAVETGLTLDDLRGVICPALDGILLPKVESAADLARVDHWIEALEAEHGLAAGAVDLIALVETARGVVNVNAIATASPRVRRLNFGAGDFCRDVGVRFSGTFWQPDGLEINAARAAVVYASRAAGLEPPIDTVWLDVRDPAGCEQDAETALRLGFGAKAAIHPGQVEIINRIFSPGPEELEYARRVVGAFEQAEAAGSASIAVDGRLVDYPIYEKAKWVLERAG
jgi:citrate lyase subunit beta/citryl-CoA lyase